MNNNKIKYYKMKIRILLMMKQVKSNKFDYFFLYFKLNLIIKVNLNIIITMDLIFILHFNLFFLKTLSNNLINFQLFNNTIFL